MTTLLPNYSLVLPLGMLLLLLMMMVCCQALRATNSRRRMHNSLGKGGLPSSLFSSSLVVDPPAQTWIFDLLASRGKGDHEDWQLAKSKRSSKKNGDSTARGKGIKGMTMIRSKKNGDSKSGNAMMSSKKGIKGMTMIRSKAGKRMNIFSRPNKSKNSPCPTELPTSMPTSVLALEPPSPPTSFPILPPEEQDKLVTCISVIDENDNKNVEDDWNELRVKFPDRPFCLLRPIPPGAGGGLSFPTTFFTDPRNIFANVTRDSADVSNPSDWYNICNLDAGKPQGLTRVVLFVDNSGSTTTSSVQNAFDLFAQRVVENGFQIVTAVENFLEDYIDPCLLTSVLPPTPP